MKQKKIIIIFLFPSYFNQLEKSHMGTAVIQVLSEGSSGRYKCEISADETFQTLSARQNMFVSSSTSFGSSLNNSFDINKYLFVYLSISIYTIIYISFQISLS